MGQRSPEDVLPRVMRRLCIFRYQCHLCTQTHETQEYISAPVSTMEEFRQQVERVINDQNTIAHMIIASAQHHHGNQGDLDDLTRRAETHGPHTPAISKTYTITDEQDYTCNNCSRTFTSNQALRAHVEAGECT